MVALIHLGMGNAERLVMGVVFILIGLFTFVCSFMDYDWFMEHRKARSITFLTRGRARTRIFYMLLGPAFMIGGVVSLVSQ